MAKKAASKTKQRTPVDSDEQHDREIMKIFRRQAARQRAIRVLAKRVVREKDKTHTALRDLIEELNARLDNGDTGAPGVV
jgi:hypothetical protein